MGSPFEALAARPRAGRSSADAHHVLAAALEAVGEAMVVCGRDGRVTDLNRHARELLGAGCDGRGTDATTWMRALQPRSASGLPLPAEDLPPLRALGGEVVQGVDVLVTLCGRDVLLEVCARPASDGRGRTRGAIITMRDVTEPRREEALRRAARRELIGPLGAGVR
jgi:PAS domain-containing protein